MEKMKGYAESFPPCSQLQAGVASTDHEHWPGCAGCCVSILRVLREESPCCAEQ